MSKAKIFIGHVINILLAYGFIYVFNFLLMAALAPIFGPLIASVIVLVAGIWLLFGTVGYYIAFIAAVITNFIMPNKREPAF